MNNISIIIPVLNEADFIGQLLQHLIQVSNPKHIAEIIVVDGGSTDGTQDIIMSFLFGRAQSRPKAVLNSSAERSRSAKFSIENSTRTHTLFISSERGRAKQMNYGAKHATGTILYFLHADSFPPKHFDQFIINEVENGNLAGCFRMQFMSKHWWLRLASWLTQFNWRACRGGDQSQFITKELFDAIGGYDERFIIYEDNILINELYKRKQFTVINQKLKTSARLYKKHGVWKVQYHFWTIYVKRWCGASAEELYAYYKKQFSN